MQVSTARAGRGRGPGPPRFRSRLRGLAVLGWPRSGGEWRREALRTNLWLLPAIEVGGAVLLFCCTYALDRAASAGAFAVPAWALSGGPDVARTVLTAIAAAVITVVGIVFSIVIVALTLTSTQFGPRMLRNFIRDRGTQFTLGTFVGTFVYTVLTLGSVGTVGGASFVPHLSVTTTLILMLADLAVLIYFLHHVAVQIQLPHVIAGIAADLQRAIEHQTGPGTDRADAELAASLVSGMPGPGGIVTAPRSGYLQYVEHRALVNLATKRDAVIHVLFRPGHFIVAGQQYATVWPAEAAGPISRQLARTHLTGSYRTLTQDVSFGMDQLVEICIRAVSTAINDTFTAMTCVDWIGDTLCKVTGRWQPTRVYRDVAGEVRVITTETTWERLVQRAFEKVRQASTGMPAVMIRQLSALVKIMERTTSELDQRVLLEQAAMIERLAVATVSEPVDRAEISRICQQVSRAARLILAAPSGVAAVQQPGGDDQRQRGPDAQHA